MGLLVVLFILAMIALNGVLAAYELALASVRVERLKALAEQHRPGAAAALEMKLRMEGSLAVVQLGITFVGAIAAATGGASMEEQVAPWFIAHLGVSEWMSDFLALTLLVVPLSAVTIIVGELVPKVFAIKNSEWVCIVLSPSMRLFAAVAFPVVWIFEQITMQMLRLVEWAFPSQPTDHPTGLHELRAQVSLLRASKVIGVQEEQIILRASRLSSMRVREIMMPKDDIVMMLADSPLTENLVIAHLDLHTRFPVAERPGDPQSIVGYVTFKEMMFLAKTHPGNPSLREITRPLISLSAELPVSEALRRMLAEHLHFAIVRDESGQVAGLITQEDIFEELVGDIQDEFDRLSRHVIPSGRQWVIGGGATLGRMREMLGRPELGGELPGRTTVNDWLNQAYDHRFIGGDSVVLDGVWLLVRKVRRRQVTEALLDPDPTRYVPSVRRAAAPAAAPPPPLADEPPTL